VQVRGQQLAQRTPATTVTLSGSPA